MFLLQSTDLYEQMAELDPTSGKLTLFSRSKNPRKTRGPVQGHFSTSTEPVGHQSASLALCLYRADGKLFFRANDVAIELDEKTHVRWKKGTRYNFLEIKRRETRHFQLKYKRPEIDAEFLLDPSSVAEEEDFDFGLFVYNVAKNPLRRKRIYAGKTGGVTGGAKLL